MVQQGSFDGENWAKPGSHPEHGLQNQPPCSGTWRPPMTSWVSAATLTLFPDLEKGETLGR